MNRPTHENYIIKKQNKCPVQQYLYHTHADADDEQLGDSFAGSSAYFKTNGTAI